MSDHPQNFSPSTTDSIVERRPSEQVMRLARLGSFHQSRLSFMRILTRRMKHENWQFSRPVFEIGDTGVGHAVFCAKTPDRTYSLVVFAHDLPAEKRSDRVIAEAWDATFTLFDGVPDNKDIERLSQNVPLQEAGRVSEKELTLARANRSVRLWAHVVDQLASGQQPDRAQVDSVGYLMRTTAVYGSGKFGAADHQTIANRPEFSAPFQAEMLTVFLARAFVRDLVQHMANAKGGAATVTLDPDIARSLGIGNSTGLGMAPFILNHPVLFNNWLMVREEAISRIRSLTHANDGEISLFRDILSRSVWSAELWHSEHPLQVEKLKHLRQDLALLVEHCESADLASNRPWDRLYRWGETALTVEGQECLASMILEPYGALVDGLEECMSDTAPALPIDGGESISAIREKIQRVYDWALTIDWDDRAQNARAWYVSEEKLEPRLGERFEEPIAEYEQPLSPGRDAAALFHALARFDGEATIAEFLLKHPQHRHTVRRVTLTDRLPYAELRDNTIGADLLPIDMLRCKLSFFGAIHFDPRSDRWVRICMYSNAPYPDELGHIHSDADYWPYPALPGSKVELQNSKPLDNTNC